MCVYFAVFFSPQGSQDYGAVKITSPPCLYGRDGSIEVGGDVDVEALEPRHEEQQAAGQQLGAPATGHQGQETRLTGRQTGQEGSLNTAPIFCKSSYYYSSDMYRLW